MQKLMQCGSAFTRRARGSQALRGPNRLTKRSAVLDTFLRSILRSAKFSLQNCAILRNTVRMPNCRNAQRPQHCATLRKRAQKSLLELYESPALPCHKPSDLTNTWQIGGHFLRFVARPFAIKEIANPNDFT
jgi:hypothetical protein